MGLITADYIKREVLRINRLLDLMHNLNLVVITKDDLIKFRPFPHPPLNERILDQISGGDHSEK
jgi:hypothetical protein